MKKDIKTKETVRNIKTKDYKDNLAYFIKEETISTKDKSINDKKDSTDKSNAQVQATDKAIHSAEITTVQAVKRTKRLIKERHHNQTTHIRQTRGTRSPKEIQVSKYSFVYKPTSEPKYGFQMKAHFLFKKRINTENSVIERPINTVKTANNTLRAAINIIKKGLFTVNHLFSYGIAVVLLVVMTLFIGVFSAFADNSVYAYSFIPLSDEVIAYTPIIEEYAVKYGIEEYVPLIQAIMMHESQGLGDDPMDSSHFEYNVQYPNGITDPEYSIEIGIYYLSDCIKEAGASSPVDTELIYLAIQGYDFGKGYIDWAISNFGGYSNTNAQLYADQMKSNLNLISYGNPHYVEQVMQYIDFGFGTFRLQPNFDNYMAWGNNNPYSRNKLYGQCTWFAWGRFYELYGYSPGFTGDGWNCAKQLVNAHPDLFELSSNPQIGSIFSCIGRNHVGIVVGWDGTNITIQEGNLDGKTNTFGQAKSDWQTVTYEINHFRNICDGVIFASKKTN